MLCKRIIPCLDVKNGRVVKGINFLNLRDAGDPVTLAQAYYEQGADELVLLDVSASVEGKATAVEMARKVAREVFIPFTIGGGIRTLRDIENLLKAGADKVSLGTAAVENPKFVEDAAKEFGSQAIVISLDAKAKKTNTSGANAGTDAVDRSVWSVYTRSASSNSTIDAIDWANKVVSLGAGEILLNSIDRDGTKEGFDIELTRTIAEAVPVPVIASGGAGKMDAFVEVFRKTKATAALAASLFHYGEIRIPDLKRYLAEKGVGVRRT